MDIVKNRRCRVCNRYLAKLASQRKRIGPTCARRERERVTAGFKSDQVRRAYDLRKHRALKQVRPGVYQVKSGGNTYLTAPTVCNCPSGRYRPVADSCYHQVAVRMEEVTHRG